MKTILITLVLLGITSGGAFAAGFETKINCVFSNKPLFRVNIHAGHFSGSLKNLTALADIVVVGPRLYLMYKTELVKTQIITRIDVGLRYYADIGQGSSISLSDVKYVPIGYEHRAGFEGTYVHKFGKESLHCNYVQ